MTANEMHARALAEWNPRGKQAVPLRQWLLLKKIDDYDCRLKAVGNCVMPRMAQLAMHIVLNHLCEAREFSC